jgi:hypothetical protein
MLTVERTAEDLLHVRADGQLTTSDYADFVFGFRRLFEPSTPMLVELGPSFSGWSLGVLWQGLEVDAQHLREFGRVAVLGDRRWESWAPKALEPFLPGELRFFETGQRPEAMQWLMKGCAKTTPK